MNSSISNSENRKRLFLFLLAFGVTLGLLHLVARKVEYFEYAGSYPEHAGLPDGDWYPISETLGREKTDSDHGLFFHNIGPFLDNALKADVLFIGDSRIMYGFDYTLLEDFFTKHGKSFFMMGFSEGENHYFFEALFEKYNFDPEVVIVNTELFFGDYQGGSYSSIVPVSPIRRFQHRISTFYEYLFFRYLRPNLPGFVVNRRGLLEDFKYARNLTFRNTKNGAWYSEQWHLEEGQPVIRFDESPPEGENSLKARLIRARELQNLFSPKKSELVFTHIPSHEPNTSSNDSRIIAESLGVRFFTVFDEKLECFDGSHLNRKSADKVTRQFISFFEESFRWGMDQAESEN